ncbi:HNH endonuclease [Bdellovibrio sp. HCB2-146]|uniref:HNH endonuclease n=1 Tax=Bdellovibrio sp. HCB2-146 TaxID=3394362 RepID=UPI0039BD1F82
MKINLNVKRISDELLVTQVKYLVQKERETTVVILRHLREMDVRKLYINYDCSSMYKYCIKHLKYTESQTQRRLSAARLLTELPELEQRVQDGDLSLTNLSNIQSFVRAESAANCPLDKTAKLELVASLENKSTRQVQKELIGKSHQPLLLAEKFKVTGQELSLITSRGREGEQIQYQSFEALLGPEQLELLQEFKNFYAHELGDMSNYAVLKFLLERAVAHKKKKLGLLSKEKSVISTIDHAVKPDNASLPLSRKVKSDEVKESGRKEKGDRTEIKPIRTAVSVQVRRKLWARAEGCCEHIDLSSKQRCSSKFALEEDHIHPVALGGKNNLENLRLLCRAHNSRRAIKTFGVYRGPG